MVALGVRPNGARGTMRCAPSISGTRLASLTRNLTHPSTDRPRESRAGKPAPTSSSPEGGRKRGKRSGVLCIYIYKGSRDGTRTGALSSRSSSSPPWVALSLFGVMEAPSGSSKGGLPLAWWRLLLLSLLGNVSPLTTPEEGRRLCLQPPLKGPCRALTTRWHYDKYSQTCKEFDYGGCKGNDNNFLSWGECAKTCSSIKKVPKICRLEADQGLCRALLRKYFFNLTSMTCEEFYYGGCNGNENRFDNKESCMDVCLPIRTGPSFCYSPKDEGLCSASVPRFYYNAKTKTCEKLTYTGCGGNNNNFLTQKDCLKVCKKAGKRKQNFIRPIKPNTRG